MSNRTTSPAGNNATTQAGTPAIPHEKIAMRAYEKWCQRGCPSGTDQQDWLEAEAELRSEMGQPRSQQPTAAQQQPAARTMAGTSVPQKTAQRR